MSRILQLSSTAQEGIRNTLAEGKVHKFVLNDEKAKKIMLEHAKVPMVKQMSESSQTTQLQLSTGAFSQVIFPLFNYWKTFPNDQVLVEDNTQVTLKEVRIDQEEKGKKVDFLAKFLFDGKKISVFAYCTNQTLMVQGISHKEFLDSFIMPLLNKIFIQKTDSILSYNEMVVKELSSPRMEMDDSVWRCGTPARGLTMKLRRSATCNECGKECTNISTLKVHTKNAHSTRNRAKPRSRNYRQLISVVTAASLPLGSDPQAPPAITYDADSELLLSDTEDSEVEVTSSTSPTILTPPARQQAVEGGGLQPAPKLVSETSLLPRSIVGEQHSSPRMESGSKEGEQHPATRLAGNPLEASQEQEDGAEASTGDEEVFNAVLPPVEVIADVSSHAGHVTPTVIIQDMPEIISTEFQCAVCEKCFTTEAEVNMHVDSHGNAETILHLMKEIFNLKKSWETKFDKQQQQVSSLQHQLTFLQAQKSKE